MKQEEKEDLSFLDYLTEEEIISILKSNRISWRTRKGIGFYLAQRNIIKLLPLIATMGIIYEIVEILEKALNHDRN